MWLVVVRTGYLRWGSFIFEEVVRTKSRQCLATHKNKECCPRFSWTFECLQARHAMRLWKNKSPHHLVSFLCWADADVEVCSFQTSPTLDWDSAQWILFSRDPGLGSWYVSTMKHWSRSCQSHYCRRIYVLYLPAGLNSLRTQTSKWSGIKLLGLIQCQARIFRLWFWDKFVVRCYIAIACSSWSFIRRIQALTNHNLSTSTETWR